MEFSEKSYFTMVDESGNEIRYEILFTFDDDDTGKHYVAYTDESVDEDGNVRIYASTYTESEDQTQLQPIETEEEWAAIQSILDDIRNELISTEPDADPD